CRGDGQTSRAAARRQDCRDQLRISRSVRRNGDHAWQPGIDDLVARYGSRAGNIGCAASCGPYAAAPEHSSGLCTTSLSPTEITRTTNDHDDVPIDEEH